MSENNFLTEVRDRIRLSLNSVGYPADGHSFNDFPNDIAQVPAIYWVKRSGDNPDTAETLTSAIGLGKQLFLRRVETNNIQHILPLIYYNPNLEFLFANIDENTGLVLASRYIIDPDLDEWIWNDEVNLNTEINDIKSKIPAEASFSNKLADKAFVNSSITNMAANYVTKDTAGNPFDSVTQLQSATVFYHGSIEYEIHNNDYTIVSVDENHNNATSRYLYDGAQWTYQYSLNNSQFTQEQWNAINSTISSAAVATINNHMNNTTIHINSTDKANWDAKLSSSENISGVITVTSNAATITGTVVSPRVSINSSIITGALGFTPMSATGILGISQGGTGATAGGSAINNLMNQVPTEDAGVAFKDDDYILTNLHATDGSVVTTAWRLRKSSELSSYIVSKTSPTTGQTPLNIATTASIGVNSSFAKSDHVHAITKAVITNVLGVTIDKSVPSNALFTDTTYVAATTAAKAIAISAAAGSSTAYARYDHVHNITKAVITNTLGFTPTSLSIGTAATEAAAGNHTHNYLPLSGGTLTGNLSVSTTGTAFKRILVENSGASIQLQVTTATAGTTSQWMGVYCGSLNSSLIAIGTLTTSKAYITTWKNIGTASTPIYFNASGQPTPCAHGIYAGTSTPAATKTAYAGCIYIKYS